jgi:hypothetical protein
MADPPDSYVLAIEQYVYWRELGLTHRQMLEAVDIINPRPHQLDAETVVRALAHAHRQLGRRRAA